MKIEGLEEVLGFPQAAFMSFILHV